MASAPPQFVAGVSPPASAPRLRAWLDEQRHGEMTWLARNEIHRVLGRERSAVSLETVTRA